MAPPPSLLNMYKELERDVAGWRHPGHGYLGGWADQGVLLLNACLTVRKGEANSHKAMQQAIISDLMKATGTEPELSFKIQLRQKTSGSDV